MYQLNQIAGHLQQMSSSDNVTIASSLDKGNVPRLGGVVHATSAPVSTRNAASLNLSERIGKQLAILEGGLAAAAGDQEQDQGELLSELNWPNKAVCPPASSNCTFVKKPAAESPVAGRRTNTQRIAELENNISDLQVVKVKNDERCMAIGFVLEKRSAAHEAMQRRLEGHEQDHQSIRLMIVQALAGFMRFEKHIGQKL